MDIQSLFTLACLCYFVQSAESLFGTRETHFYMLMNTGGLKDWKTILYGHGFNDPLKDKHVKTITEIIPEGNFRSSIGNIPCDQVYIVLYNSVGDVLWWIGFNGSFGDVNLFSSSRITGSSNVLTNNNAITLLSDSHYQLLIGPTYKNTSAWMVTENGNGADEMYPLFWFSKDSSTAHTVYKSQSLIKLLGCETQDNFLQLKLYVENITNMTVEVCYEYCRESAKSLTVLTMGYQCFCAEIGEEETLSNMSKCTTQCKGNTSQACGDDSGELYSVYGQETEIQPVTMPKIPLKFTNMECGKVKSSNEIMVTAEDFPFRPSNYILALHVQEPSSYISSPYSVYYSLQDCDGTSKKQLVNQTTLLPQIFSTDIRYETPLIYFGCLWIQFETMSFEGQKSYVTLSFVDGDINFLPADYLAVVGFSNTSSTTMQASTQSTDETDRSTYFSGATTESTVSTKPLTTTSAVENTETTPSSTREPTVSEGNTSTQTSTETSMNTQQETNDQNGVSSTLSSTSTYTTHTTSIGTPMITQQETNDQNGVSSTLSSTSTYTTHTTVIGTPMITQQETNDQNGVSSTLASPTTYPTDDYETTNEATSTYKESTTSCCMCLSPVLINITNEELQQKLDEVRKILMVEKETLSSSKRKLTSAPDDRPSARGIGYCGILVLLVALISVILLDFNVFYTVVKSRFYTSSNV